MAKVSSVKVVFDKKTGQPKAAYVPISQLGQLLGMRSAPASEAAPVKGKEISVPTNGAHMVAEAASVELVELDGKKSISIELKPYAVEGVQYVAHSAKLTAETKKEGKGSKWIADLAYVQMAAELVKAGQFTGSNPRTGTRYVSVPREGRPALPVGENIVEIARKAGFVE